MQFGCCAPIDKAAAVHAAGFDYIEAAVKALIPDEDDDGIPFEEKMATLTAELRDQMQEADALDTEIRVQLAKVGFEL